jgi:hypothetical protein
MAPTSATWAASVESRGPTPPPSMAWTDAIGVLQIEWRQEVPTVWKLLQHIPCQIPNAIGNIFEEHPGGLMSTKPYRACASSMCFSAIVTLSGSCPS